MTTRQIATRHIAPNLYAINLGNVNAFLLDAADGLTLIDTGFAGSEEKIFQAVRALGKAPKNDPNGKMIQME